MNVLLMRWDTKPDKRIRGTFPRHGRHAERLSMPLWVVPMSVRVRLRSCPTATPHEGDRDHHIEIVQRDRRTKGQRQRILALFMR